MSRLSVKHINSENIAMAKVINIITYIILQNSVNAHVALTVIKGHCYKFILSFVLISCRLFLFLLFFFPRLISAVAEWMSAILAHMVWR